MNDVIEVLLDLLKISGLLIAIPLVLVLGYAVICGAAEGAKEGVAESKEEFKRKQIEIQRRSP